MLPFCLGRETDRVVGGTGQPTTVRLGIGPPHERDGVRAAMLGGRRFDQA